MNDALARNSNTAHLRDVQAYRNGEPGAADRLTTSLYESVTRDVNRFLGADHADRDDVVQESLVATLQYLDRDADFVGDLARLAVTIARNRCRDLIRWHQRRPGVTAESLADWLADPRRSALDDLENQDLLQRLQTALDRLSNECRKLLKSTYLEGESVESVRKRLQLGTVQGVYYRRSVCLRQVRELLKRGPRDRSDTGGNEK